MTGHVRGFRTDTFGGRGRVAVSRRVHLARFPFRGCGPVVPLAVAPLRSEVTRLSPLNVYDDDDAAEDGR